jgi:hypothetical protein
MQYLGGMVFMFSIALVPPIKNDCRRLIKKILRGLCVGCKLWRNNWYGKRQEGSAWTEGYNEEGQN